MNLVFKVEFLLLLVGGQREILKKLQNKMQFVLMKRHQSAPAYAAFLHYQQQKSWFSHVNRHLRHHSCSS